MKDRGRRMELENLVKLIQTVSDSDLTGFQYEENGVKLKIQKEKEQMVVSTAQHRWRQYKTCQERRAMQHQY